MQNQHSQYRLFPIKILLLSLMCIFLVGCSPAKKTASPLPTQPTETSDSIAVPVIPSLEISTIEPTKVSTSLLIPAAPIAVSAKSSGLVIFSMGDGVYSHLFVYGPEFTPMTRLTNGNWDDEDPALSPDGTKVAFSSNRNGQWDIYIIDLKSNTVQPVTQTKTYDGSPSWSPDGQYLIYQTLDGENLDLIVQSISDPTAAPIQLTAKSGNNFDPAWSPDGHTIAFITDRGGQNELWLADLQSIENRFTKLAVADQAEYRYPNWSPDGSTLAWCKQNSESHIEILEIAQKNSLPREIGLGCHPVWSPDASSIMATLDQVNAHYLVAYQIQDKTIFLSPVQTTSEVNSLAWVSTEKSQSITNFVNQQNLPAPMALFSPALTLPLSATGRKGVVKLDDVDVPQAYLADAANEAFIALRQGIGKKTGWDFLASLENAYLPLTSKDSPGLTQNWLYTGRAIDVNTVPMDAGWMAVSREDFNGLTYWRMWLKCIKQDGSCGKPMETAVWDFSSRFDSDPEAYENGGKVAAIPAGYWVDFTEFANRYGWDRSPSQADWRYYYPGILFNQLIYAQGLTWTDAMLELYPSDAIQSLSSTK